MGKERPFRLLTLAAILCRTRLWARRKPLWKAVPARTADLSRSTYRRNAPPSMKRPWGRQEGRRSQFYPEKEYVRDPGRPGERRGTCGGHLVALVPCVAFVWAAC